MKRLLSALILILLLAACGQAETPPEVPSTETEDASGVEADVLSPDEGFHTEAAVLEGEGLSPDGRFCAQVTGAREGSSTGGPSIADSIQITDAKTGEIVWEDFGAYEQSILWSPEGGFAALARTARTWCSITIIETESWTSWDFTRPDGSSIPEHAFLPDDEPWGVWTGEGILDLTIGRGGDAGEQSFYTCAVLMRDGELMVTVWEELHETLPGNYDFNHDGEPEIVELAAVYDGEQNRTGWCALQVRTADSRSYWSRSLHTVHPGWGSYFACRVDGEDCLLRYTPTMYQGFATYSYELFSLDRTGEEQLIREGSVDFDVNFGSPMHEGFDSKAIAAFLEEVHRLLEDSELLVTTENGEFRSGGPGAEFKDDLDFWMSDELYHDSRSLEENIRAIRAYWEEMQEAG